MTQGLGGDASDHRGDVAATAALGLAADEGRQELEVEPGRFVAEDVLGDRRSVIAQELLPEPALRQALGDGPLAGREPSRCRDVGILGAKGLEGKRARLRP